MDFGLDARNARVADEVAALVRTWTQASNVSVDPLEDGAVFVRFGYGR
jgi:hypothetical protein